MGRGHKSLWKYVVEGVVWRMHCVWVWWLADYQTWLTDHLRTTKARYIIDLDVLHCAYKCIAAEIPTIAATSSVSRDSRCPKCGITKKSGKLSCCARGGSWFKTCGDSGDAQYNHTWIEGFRVCDIFASFDEIVSTKLIHEVMLEYMQDIARQPNATKIHNFSQQQQTSIYSPGSVNIVSDTNCKIIFQLSNAVVYASTLFMLSQLQLCFNPRGFVR